MTQRQFIRLLRSEVDKSPTRWKAAERLNISETSLSRILNCKQEPSAPLLKRYGLVRQVVYVPGPVKPLVVKEKIVTNGVWVPNDCEPAEG
jgi:hypothetical protein